MKRIIRGAWILFLAGFGFFLLYIFAVYINLFGLFGEIPDFEILENPKSELASELYTSDGKVLGKYFSTNRSKVEFDELSKNVIKALIATEDSRFMQHSGIDSRATIRLIGKLGRAGGGSTITQQLAKNLFKLRQNEKYKVKIGFGPLRMLAVKTKEWTTAKRLEEAYTKKEIITMYLNTVEFGRGSFGIQAAAKTYFNKNQEDLTLPEAAVLIGKLKATSYYDPISNPKNALRRRNTVMHQMTRFGDEAGPFLSQAAYDSLKTKPIELDYKPENYHQGPAAYFRANIKKELKNLPELADYNLSTSGLRIYTTIDSRLQQYAEKAVHDNMKSLQAQFRKDWGKRTPWDKAYLKKKMRQQPYYKTLVAKYGAKSDSIEIMLNKPRRTSVFSYDSPNGTVDTTLTAYQELEHHLWFLRCGFMSMDPHSGHVKAWVGGINNQHFSYDHVRQGSRQAGSVFKPFVYSAAINNGYSICQRFVDGPVSITLDNGQVWSPRSKPTGEMYTLKAALAKSLNNYAALMISKVGVKPVIEHVREFGISTPIDSAYSIALGTSSVNLYEMVAAYSVFVNGGTYHTPVFIDRIEDKYGKVIYSAADDERYKLHTVMKPENAYKVVSMLKEGPMIGTSIRLRTQYGLLNGYNQIGGKTGTTQNSADGWFMGISKDLVSGCWVGGEDNIIHFNSSYHGQGARMAMPIFGDYMVSAYKDPQTGIKRGVFPTPAGITEADVICDQELIEGDGNTLLPGAGGSVDDDDEE